MSRVIVLLWLHSFGSSTYIERQSRGTFHGTVSTTLLLPFVKSVTSNLCVQVTHSGSSPHLSVTSVSSARVYRLLGLCWANFSHQISCQRVRVHQGRSCRYVRSRRGVRVLCKNLGTRDMCRESLMTMMMSSLKGRERRVIWR